MMKLKNYNQIFLLLLFCGCLLSYNNKAYAQSNQASNIVIINIVQPVSLSINSGQTSSIQIDSNSTESTTQQMISNSDINETSWINYSAVSVESRDIHININSGSIPTGLKLQLNATKASTDKNGSQTQSVDQVVISHLSQRLDNSVKKCFTSEGQYAGNRLSYSLAPTGTNQNSQTIDNKYITVCYTISD